MTDRNRNQGQQDRDQQQNAGREEMNPSESIERDRGQRGRESVADDRGLRGGREDVDLGTDPENEPGADAGDEELGGPGGRDR